MNGRMELTQKEWAHIEDIIKVFPDYVVKWKDYMRAKNASPNTVFYYLKRYEHYLESIDPNIKEITTEQLTVQSIWRFMESVNTVVKNGETVPSSNSFRNLTWSALNNLFKFLKRMGYLSNNPMDQTDVPGGSDRAEIDSRRVILTKEDFKKIMTAVEHDYNNRFYYRDCAIISIFLCTGMRLSALLSINVGDIDLDEGTIIYYDKGSNNGKFHKKYLSDFAYSHVANWIDHRDEVDTDALFISKTNKRLTQSTVADLVRKYTEKAIGKRLSPHKLRAGLVTILYNETKDPYFVQQFIGHAFISTTQLYIVSDQEEIAEKGSDIIDDIF